MSSSSIDLGKSILAKLQQIQPKKQNSKTNAGPKRPPPGPGPSSSSSFNRNGATDHGRSNPQKKASVSSDSKPSKPNKKRKNKKQQKTTENQPSSDVKRDETQGKRPSTKTSSPPPDDMSKDHQKSKQESVDQVEEDEEDNRDENSDQDESDDHEILLAEIKNLGGTEDDLDLFEGSPWKEAVIQEDHVVDDVSARFLPSPNIHTIDYIFLNSYDGFLFLQ
jgi:hypothetical protein